MDAPPAGSLADRLRRHRLARRLSLDALAKLVGISKTYLWELESDVSSAKRPSADVLARLAGALGVSLGDLLGVPVVAVGEAEATVGESLAGFAERMATLGAPLSGGDVGELAAVRFRGRQPGSVDGWHDLYRALTREGI